MIRSYYVVVSYATPSLTFRGHFWGCRISKVLRVIRGEISKRVSCYGLYPVKVRVEEI